MIYAKEAKTTTTKHLAQNKLSAFRSVTTTLLLSSLLFLCLLLNVTRVFQNLRGGMEGEETFIKVCQ